MAEIASAYPTAGGLYFWAMRMGGRRWAWVTAWLNMIGQVTITAGINIAAAIYIIGIVTEDATSWMFQVLVMVLILIPQVIINLWGVRLTARLSDLSVWWHIGGVFLIIGLLVFAGTHRNPSSFLVSFAPTTDFAAPPLMLFVLALLQAQWTYTGYDASAHMAEETKSARMNSAWGIVLSVAVSAVVGYAMLMVLTWSIPNGDVAATANDPYPVLYVVRNNLAPAAANAIAIVIGGAMWLCGVASVTSMGRMWYAFARDDGMPGSRWLKLVNAKTHTPVIAIIVTSALSVLICIYAAAFTVVTSISTISLYLAYGIPVFLNLRNRLRGRGEWTSREIAPWNTGRWSPLINTIALVWIAFITVVFMLPPNQLVMWTMLGFAVLLAVYYAITSGGKRDALP